MKYKIYPNLANWIRGEQRGMGKLTHPSLKYEGEFRDEMPEGSGKFIFDIGYEQHGYYESRDIMGEVDDSIEVIGREAVWIFEKLTVRKED